MGTATPQRAVAERLADAVIALRDKPLSPALRARAEELLIDVSGLCVAARSNDYMQALIAGVDAGGGCTALGHAATFRAEDAAMINGTAAHGEDFDDTFEGGPVHSSAVVV